MAWLRENHKVSNLWYWPALTLLCAISLLSGYAQFIEYRAEFLAQKATWTIIWGQGSSMSSMLFTPLVVDVFTIQSAAGEYEGQNWQRMSIPGLAGTTVMDKLLHTAQTALVSALVFLTGLTATGLPLGLDPAEPSPYPARVVLIALSMWVVRVFVVWVGAIANSSTVIMSILLLTIIGGSALSLIVLLVASLYPPSLITPAFTPHQPGSIVPAGSMSMTGPIAAVWVVFWASALLCRIVRNP